MNSYMDRERQREPTLDDSNLFIYRQLVIEPSRILVIIEQRRVLTLCTRCSLMNTHRQCRSLRVDVVVPGELSDRLKHIHRSERPVRGRVIIENPSWLVFIPSVILSCDY